MPTDLAKVESYKAYEDAERAKMEAAKANLAKIEPILKKIHALDVS